MFRQGGVRGISPSLAIFYFFTSPWKLACPHPVSLVRPVPAFEADGSVLPSSIIGLNLALEVCSLVKGLGPQVEAWSPITAWTSPSRSIPYSRGLVLSRGLVPQLRPGSHPRGLFLSQGLVPQLQVWTSPSRSVPQSRPGPSITGLDLTLEVCSSVEA